MEHKVFSSHTDTSLESNSSYVCDEEEVLISVVTQGSFIDHSIKTILVKKNERKFSRLRNAWTSEYKANVIKHTHSQKL